MKGELNMGMFEVVGTKNSELEGVVFAQCTNKELANKAMEILLKTWEVDPEDNGEIEVRESNLRVNTIVLDDQEIDLVAELEKDKAS